MDAGELCTRWTVRLALLLYALVVAGRLRGGGRAPLLRGAWTLGCALFVAHVVSAFHFQHHWSHAAAYAETARRTAELFGWSWGGGLYLNYLFTLLWVGDVCWWWRAPGSYTKRPRWLDMALFGFMAFMAFNGAVVFATGLVRWLGLAVMCGLGVLWVFRRTSNRREDS
jgi:hypothetical protein